MNTKISIFLLAGSIAFSSCRNNTVPPIDENSSTYIINSKMSSELGTLSKSNWTFVNYAKNTLISGLEKRATLNFDIINGGIMSYNGQSFVNFYIGSIEVDEKSGLIIKQSESISTKMASLDETMSKAEMDYQLNLSKVTYFEIVDNHLLLYIGNKNDTKTEVMLFEKAN